MAGIKELKTRIKSIGGTRKVTRAMQMVSAAKMRKSQDATLRSRGYASLAWELITNLTSHVGSSISSESDESRNLLFFDNHKATDPSASTFAKASADESVGMERLLTTFPKASKIAVLILTTNRGMVGSLNANLVNLVQKTINDFTLSPNPFLSAEASAKAEALSADIITYGRKGRDVMVKSHKEVLADFEKFDRVITTQDIAPIANFITNLYTDGKYQKVLIFYNHFVSTLAQKPTVKQLLPFAKVSEQWAVNSGQKKAETAELPTTHYPSRLGGSPRLRESEAGRAEADPLPTSFDYLFEPDPKEVLEHLLPRIIESQIYQTILESEASEQSARMVMMKNATEAAGDLISDLTLTYNKLRQNKITTELAEITAGKIALE